MTRDDDGRLEQAVSLGIISEAQAALIRGLPPRAAAHEAPGPARHEVTGASLGAVTIGYALGALTVLVAMAWFLADRWEWLGAGGALSVCLLYALLFLVVARRLGREGYPVASGLAVVLAVAMTPVATVALIELTDLVVRAPAAACRYPDFTFWTCRSEELLVELATLAAALIALRQLRFALLVLPVAGIGLRLLFHASDAIWRSGLGPSSAGWVWVIGASLLTAAAYETSRRQRGDADFAFFLHLVAALGAGIATMLLFERYAPVRHLLVPGALIAFAFSLRMRRAAWTVLGLLWFVTYLGWLAGEVFEDTPFFPIVLAALGVGVIILTVWIQRNSAGLVARFGGLGSDARPSFPGGLPLILAPILAALLQLPSASALDRAERRDAELQGARARRQAAMQRESIPRRSLRRDSLRGPEAARPAGTAGETGGVPHP